MYVNFKIGDWTKHDYKLPDELLTEDEVMKMIEVAEHPRDKAVAIVSGKTGMRRVRLIFSAVYFASWLDIHPGRDNPKAPLWIGVGTVGKGEAMNYSAFRALLQRVAEKAAIKKKVNPHNVHLSGRDVDAALLKLQGEEIEEAKETSREALHEIFDSWIDEVEGMTDGAGLGFLISDSFFLDINTQQHKVFDGFSYVSRTIGHQSTDKICNSARKNQSSSEISMQKKQIVQSTQ